MYTTLTYKSYNGRPKTLHSSWTSWYRESRLHYSLVNSHVGMPLLSFVNIFVWNCHVERSSRWSQREDDVECRQIISKQQDPRSHEVVQRHPEGHLLPEEDPVQSNCYILHQKLVEWLCCCWFLHSVLHFMCAEPNKSELLYFICTSLVFSSQAVLEQNVHPSKFSHQCSDACNLECQSNSSGWKYELHLCAP